MQVVETKFALGKYWKPVKMVYDCGRIFFPFIGFNKIFNAEVKMMEGHNYHGYEGAPYRDYCIKTFKRDKLWSCKDSQHNAFHIAFLEGKKPYERYQREIAELRESERPLYVHQFDMTAFMLARRQCIIAGEMGVGKTLSEIEARETIKPNDAWYVAPRSALKAVERELKKWGCTNRPELMTYQGLVKRMTELEGQDWTPPQWLTFDESSCVKTPTAQRSQAARMAADAVREHWGDDGYIILMTGTPAPKSPLDWWHQCEIARPGYLIEGDLKKFKARLAVLVDRDFGGGVHKHIAGWKDRDDICDKCGLVEEDPVHLYNAEMEDADASDDTHEFKLAINEVKKLFTRMDGLVIVKKKADCLDLPPMRYEEHHLEPTKKLLQIARTMCRTAPSVAEALTRCRTLSDGFMYEMEKVGVKECPCCEGKKEIFDWVLKERYEGEPISDYDENGDIMDDEQFRARFFDRKLIECSMCGGKGEIDAMARHTNEVHSPKEDKLKELIGEHAEIGRLVVYGAFQGSVDKITRIFSDMEWATIRWDGRGVHCSVPDIDPLDLFQDAKGDFPKVGFIGQPGAAGMGLTLTASPSCVFYSNTFNAVDRLQAKDRIHRISMDVIRGATLHDLFHLPTDYLVAANLVEKIARQDLTQGLDISMADVMESLNG